MPASKTSTKQTSAKRQHYSEWEQTLQDRRAVVDLTADSMEVDDAPPSNDIPLREEESLPTKADSTFVNYWQRGDWARGAEKWLQKEALQEETIVVDHLPPLQNASRPQMAVASSSPKTSPIASSAKMAPKTTASDSSPPAPYHRPDESFEEEDDDQVLNAIILQSRSVTSSPKEKQQEARIERLLQPSEPRQPSEQRKPMNVTSTIASELQKKTTRASAEKQKAYATKKSLKAQRKELMERLRRLDQQLDQVDAVIERLDNV
jgi:hypothetical protein